MKIEDDFLEQTIFDELQACLMGQQFSWVFTPYIVYENDKDVKFQLVHVFYALNAPQSSLIEKLHPILNKINLISLFRIKANLLTRTPNIIENEFHVDMPGVSKEKLKQWTTSIFYVNTNNGYTEFEDGTKVESVANRMVTFPTNLKHRGTSCTDEKIRIVINFNYFK